VTTVRDLEVYRAYYHHPEGKQYMIVIVRDSNDKTGTCVGVKMWGKLVSPDFSAGQAQAILGDWRTVAAEVNKEHAKRTSASKGYVEDGTIGPGHKVWTTVSHTQLNYLGSKIGRDILDEFNPPGVMQPAWPNNPSSTVPEEKEEVPSGPVVPGPTVTPAKRVDWVIANPTHPEAMSQMIHAAGQMKKMQGDLEAKLGKLTTDLQFAESWMRQRLRQAG